jgi:hypothetical protein
MFRVAALALLGLAGSAMGDVYMHNPRGSNCRLNEANTNRNNGNRLFDTQNNAKGGYCWGPAMSYYEGSELTIEWTNQHGCGNPKLECNLVIQYMCGLKEDDPEKQIRDGTTTNTIPNDLATYNQKDAATGEYEFGMHESIYFYRECRARNRNGGLFLADRETENGVANHAGATRQNNGGNRRGFECAEERDYYPYWHPSPWKDIAILTNSEEQCKYYKEESFNVKEKGHCKGEIPTDGTAPTFRAENTETECQAQGFEWEVVDAHWPGQTNMAPDCVLAPWNRHNHLGNGVNGFTNHYNWTLPNQDQEECIKDDDCNCVVRLRYNISTADLNGWGLRSKGDELDGEMSDLTQNKENSPVKDDPYVPVPGDAEKNISLAIDTTQFGRTFQDRSHVFHIKPRPTDMGVTGATRIYNLNVRGKRGNIVQTYPAVEYDFVPQHLEAKVGDFVHFQWTGCDTNPAGNAGEGTDQTDRSDIVQLAYLDASYPATEEWLNDPANNAMFDDMATHTRMSQLDQEDCLSYGELMTKNNNNNNNVEQDVQNCMKLNAQPTPYFDGGLHRMNRTGDYQYMSARNNNFSNRGQKGIMKIDTMLELWAIIMIAVAGTLFVGAGATAGGIWYSQSHPHSAVAQVFDKFSS